MCASRERRIVTDRAKRKLAHLGNIVGAIQSTEGIHTAIALRQMEQSWDVEPDMAAFFWAKVRNRLWAATL